MQKLELGLKNLACALARILHHRYKLVSRGPLSSVSDLLTLNHVTKSSCRHYHGVLLGPCNGVNKIQVLVYIFILCLLNICHYTTHIYLQAGGTRTTRPPSITRGMTLCRSHESTTANSDTALLPSKHVATCLSIYCIHIYIQCNILYRAHLTVTRDINKILN